MDEIWKDVKGYEGFYEVSNLGRVRSVDRYVNYKTIGKCLRKGKLLKLKDAKDGYKKVTLSVNQKTKNIYIHRLVALAFIPNPNNYPCINHKNEIRVDNRVENLEWCTVAYNNTYGDRICRVLQTRVNNGFNREEFIGLTKKEYNKKYYAEIMKRKSLKS